MGVCSSKKVIETTVVKSTQATTETEDILVEETIVEATQIVVPDEIVKYLSKAELKLSRKSSLTVANLLLLIQDPKCCSTQLTLSRSKLTNYEFSSICSSIEKSKITNLILKQIRFTQNKLLALSLILPRIKVKPLSFLERKF
jgi:hypothetical protein